MPPDSGYGPVNYGNHGADPFSAFDNRINYNDMVRQQMISQYAQSVVRPATMTLAQQRSIANESRFQYGVPGGQDSRFYQRQAELSRLSYATASGVMGADLATYGAGGAAMSAIGIGGLAGFALPIGMSLAAMHFVNKGVQNSLDRRTYMHNIASDVEQYKDRLGFSSALSYGQASALGASMERSMSAPGQFFSKSQQMKIHKLGLSNNLLSSKGQGADSGTINQYKRNFEDLKSTTEDVVKLLQTTIEGGMSVIKELQQKGFGNIKQIKQQVIQAKSFGNVTGIGTQNMMNIGAAGAQAVQGTPWAASVGANMYQYGVTQASLGMQGNPGMARAVTMAGGTAAAGGMMANNIMNMMSSGIGTKLAAYAMNIDGSINDSKLARIMSGSAGAYEIVSGANATGYGMGSSKVRFQMFKEDMMNKIGEDPAALGMLAKGGFNAWAGQKYGKLEDKAYAFSGLFTNDSRSRRLMYESLLANPNLGRIGTSNMIENASLNKARYKDPYKGVLQKITGGISGAATRFGDYVGEGIVDTAEDVLSGFDQVRDVVGEVASGLTERIGMGLGIYGRYGRGGAGPGSIRTGLGNLYGAGRMTKRGMSLLRSGIPGGGAKVLNIKPVSIDEAKLEANMNKMGSEGVTSVLMDMAVTMGNQTYDDARSNIGMLTMMGIDRRRASKMSNDAFQSQIYTTYNKATAITESHRSKFQKATATIQNEIEARTGASKESIMKARADILLLNFENGSTAENINTARKIAEGYGVTSTAATKGLIQMAESFKMSKVSPTGSLDLTDVYGSAKNLEKATREAFSLVSGGGTANTRFRNTSLKRSGTGALLNKALDLLDLKGDSGKDILREKIRLGRQYYSEISGQGEAGEASTAAFKELMELKAKGADFTKLLGFKGGIESKAVDEWIRAGDQFEYAGALRQSRGAFRALRHNMNEKVFRSKKDMQSFDEGMSKIASGEMRDPEEWSSFRRNNAKYLENMYGTVAGRFNDMKTSGDLLAFTHSQEALKSLDERTSGSIRRQQMRNEMLAITDLLSGKVKRVEVYDGKDKKILTKDDLEEARREKERLGYAVEDLNADMRSREDTTQTPGLTASVKSPIMNYWNNTWTL